MLSERSKKSCRKLICLVSAIVFAGLAVTSTAIESSAATMNGDINGDNTVNVIDGIILKEILLNHESASIQSDIDFDGTTTVKDLALMTKYLIGIASLPVRIAEEGTYQAVLTDDMSIRKDDKTTDDPAQICVAGDNSLSPRYAYIKFSTSGIPLSSTSKAILKLKVANTSNGNTDVKVYLADNNWNDNNVPKFDSRPQLKSDMLDAVTIVHKSSNNSDALSNLAFFHSSKATDSAAQAPQLEIKCGGETTSYGEIISADNAAVRLETAVSSGKYIRTSGTSLAIEKNVSPLYDAKFNEANGFMDNTVSLESVSKPGYFLCRSNGSSEIVLLQNNNSEEFKRNASFVKTKGLSKGISYGIYGENERYIKNINGHLVAGFAENAAQKSSASFLVRSEANVQIKDEFNGNTLDTSIWAYHYPWGTSHNHSGTTRESQVAVKDGKLVLTATRVAGDNWVKDHKGETGYTDNIGESQWRKFSHITGVVHLPFSKCNLSGNVYIETSLKMPNKTGFWPAFWINGNNSWPPEIDMIEYLSNTPEKIYHCIHKYNSSVSNNDQGAGKWITKSASFFQNEFHKYALDWGETYINYYIDDVLTYSVTDTSVIQNQKNMYLIINLGVGGWATEPTDNVGNNTTYECDYVRIYGY